MKTVLSLKHEANNNMDLWQSIMDDEEALEDRRKTREQAIRLFEYYQGRFDAFCEALTVLNR